MSDTAYFLWMFGIVCAFMFGMGLTLGIIIGHAT